MKPIGEGAKERLKTLEKQAAKAPKGRARLTERGELMRFFCRHLNLTRVKVGY